MFLKHHSLTGEAKPHLSDNLNDFSSLWPQNVTKYSVKCFENRFQGFCTLTPGALVRGSLITFSCSAWRSWSQVCSRWCCGWPTPLNCCTSSSTKSLSCCPGGRTRRMKVLVISRKLRDVGAAEWVCLSLRLVCMFCQVCWILRCRPLGQPARKPWQSWKKSSCSPFSSLSTT